MGAGADAGADAGAAAGAIAGADAGAIAGADAGAIAGADAGAGAEAVARAFARAVARADVGIDAGDDAGSTAALGAGAGAGDLAALSLTAKYTVFVSRPLDVSVSKEMGTFATVSILWSGGSGWMTGMCKCVTSELPVTGGLELLGMAPVGLSSVGGSVEADKPSGR